VLAAVSAGAQQSRARLKLEMKAEREVEVERDGKRVVERAPADRTRSGDLIVYTIAYANPTEEPVGDASLVGPVPAATVYVAGSAEKRVGMEQRFSIDGGKSFKAPPITYKVRKPDGAVEEKPAPPEMFTHVRWVLSDAVPPGGSGSVSYKVRVK